VDQFAIERRQYRVEVYRCQRAARGDSEPDWIARWECIERLGSYSLRAAFYRRIEAIAVLANEQRLGYCTAMIVDEETGKAL
jgi:hypothetical protein